MQALLLHVGKLPLHMQELNQCQPVDQEPPSLRIPRCGSWMSMSPPRHNVTQQGDNIALYNTVKWMDLWCRATENNSNGLGRQMTKTNSVFGKVASMAASQNLWWTTWPCRHVDLASNNSTLRDRETDYCSQQICFLTCTQPRHVSDWVTVMVIYTCKLYPASFCKGRIRFSLCM